MAFKKTGFGIVIAICLIGGALLGAVLTGTPLTADADSKQAQITATGTSIVNTSPDQAKICLGVLTTAPNAKKAQEENATLTNKVIDALTKAGINKNKIETQGYSIWPEYSYPKQGNKPPVITAYRASNTLLVTIDELNKTGKIIDTAVAAGANKVENIQFLKKDTGPVQREALQKACKEARLKAEAMAAGLGVKLGSIASVEESSSSSSPIPFYRNDVKTMEEESAPTTIQPGELEISACVTVVHHIK